MDDVVLLNPNNQDLLEGRIWRIPAGAESPPSALFNLISSVLMLLVCLLMLPFLYREKVQYDAFVATSPTMEATVTGCRSSILPSFGAMSFTYSPDSTTEMSGYSNHWGSCDRYPAGAPVMIHYLPSNPWQADTVTNIESSTFIFYMFLFNTAITLPGLRRHYRDYLRSLLLKRSGQIRHGRIVSLKPSRLSRKIITVSYEVPNDDGSVATGKQIVKRDHPEQLAPDSPLAILYADPKTHFVL
jgi:hypothetical protein